MRSRCIWTPCKVLSPLSFKPSSFFTFSFPKQLLLPDKSIAAISSTRRGISSYPSLMASSPSLKDAVSTQNESTQKTQQPLQVIRFLFSFINIFLANSYAHSLFFIWVLFLFLWSTLFSLWFCLIPQNQDQDHLWFCSIHCPILYFCEDYFVKLFLASFSNQMICLGNG